MVWTGCSIHWSNNCRLTSVIDKGGAWENEGNYEASSIHDEVVECEIQQELEKGTPCTYRFLSAKERLTESIKFI